MPSSITTISVMNAVAKKMMTMMMMMMASGVTIGALGTEVRLRWGLPQTK